MSAFGTIEEGIKWAMRFVTAADRAYALLREEGYAWTRAAVREAWKNVGEKEAWATVLETWGPDKIAPRRWQVEGPKGMTTDYQILLKYTLMDTETGELTTRYASVATDKLKSFEETYKELEDDLRTYAIMENAILLEWAPGGVLRRG